MLRAPVGSAVGAFQLGKARLGQSLEIFPMQNAVSVKTRISEKKISLLNSCIFSFTRGRNRQYNFGNLLSGPFHVTPSRIISARPGSPEDHLLVNAVWCDMNPTNTDTSWEILLQ